MYIIGLISFVRICIRPFSTLSFLIFLLFLFCDRNIPECNYTLPLREASTKRGGGASPVRNLIVFSFLKVKRCRKFWNVKICTWKDFKLFWFFSSSKSYILDHYESLDMNMKDHKRKNSVSAKKNDFQSTGGGRKVTDMFATICFFYVFPNYFLYYACKV